MYGELGYVAAYVHLFYVLSCVERYAAHVTRFMWDNLEVQ
jgi:hypothetical protein